MTTLPTTASLAKLIAFHCQQAHVALLAAQAAQEEFDRLEAEQLALSREAGWLAGEREPHRRYEALGIRLVNLACRADRATWLHWRSRGYADGLASRLDDTVLQQSPSHQRAYWERLGQGGVARVKMLLAAQEGKEVMMW